MQKQNTLQLHDININTSKHLTTLLVHFKFINSSTSCNLSLPVKKD